MLRKVSIGIMLSVAAGITPRALEDVRGSELIHDTSSSCHQANKGDTAGNEIYSLGETITLHQLQSHIESHGHASTRESVIENITTMYSHDAVFTLGRLRTLLNEQHGLLTSLMHQLEIYYMSSEHTYRSPQYIGEMQQALSNMRQESGNIQYNLPSPATLESLKQGSYAAYQLCITLDTLIENEKPTPLPSFDATMINDTISNIATLLVANTEYLSRLEHNVNYIHLSWINVTYRNLCAQLDRLPKKAIGFTATTGTLAFLVSLRYIPNHYLEGKWLNWLYTIKRAIHGPYLDQDNQEDCAKLYELNGKKEPSFPYTKTQKIAHAMHKTHPMGGTGINSNNITETLDKETKAIKQQLAYEAQQNGISFEEQLQEAQKLYSPYTICKNIIGHPISIALTGTTALGNLSWGMNQVKEFDGKLGISKHISSFFNRAHNYLRGAPKQNAQRRQYITDLTLDDPRFNVLRQLLEPFFRILDYMKNPSKYTHGGLTIPKTILITGNSGSGKSFAAQAFAGSLHQQQKEHGGSALFWDLQKDDWSNLKQMGAPNAAKVLLQFAKENAPCVIFIDEIHTYNLQDNTNSTILNEFLQELDNIDLNRDPEQQVFVVAATNKPEKLDRALRREGRFGDSARIHLPDPGFEQRKAILQTRCDQLAIDTTQSDIDLDYLASLTAGASLSSIEKLFERATFSARSQNQPVTLEHFYKALNRVTRKINPTAKLSLQEQYIIAANIAAQALMQYLINPELVDAMTICAINQNIQEVNAIFDKKDNHTLQKQIEYGDIFLRNTYEYLSDQSTQTYRNRCKQLLAGKIGEELITGVRSSYREEDAVKAYEIALELACDGIPFKELSQEQQNKKRDEAQSLYVQLRNEARQQIENHTAILQHMQQELVQEQFLHKPILDTIWNEHNKGVSAA